MAGMLPLTDAEAALVNSNLTCARDRCLFILGLRTGLRVSEMTGTRKDKDTGIEEYVGLRVKDVWKLDQVVNVLWVAKRKMKGGRAQRKPKSRYIPLHEEARAAIEEHLKTLPDRSPEAPLFQTRQGIMSRFTAHKILKEAFHRSNLIGRYATHSMRKTFAKKMYAALDRDLISTRDALGHSDIRNTIDYLAPNQGAIDAAILKG